MFNASCTTPPCTIYHKMQEYMQQKMFNTYDVMPILFQTTCCNILECAFPCAASLCKSMFPTPKNHICIPPPKSRTRNLRVRDLGGGISGGPHSRLRNLMFPCSPQASKSLFPSFQGHTPPTADSQLASLLLKATGVTDKLSCPWLGDSSLQNPFKI